MACINTIWWAQRSRFSISAPSGSFSRRFLALWLSFSLSCWNGWCRTIRGYNHRALNLRILSSTRSWHAALYWRLSPTPCVKRREPKNLAREYAASQDKTRQLEIANKYKSHFLASASHDLRQPLHALNLFVAQLRSETKPAERDRLVARIDAAVGSMNELFEALLDMTKLEAGILQPKSPNFPSSGCSIASRRPSPMRRRKRGCGCAWFAAARGFAATPFCWSASCSIWCPMPCATRRAAAWWSAAAAVATRCASMFATPDPAFRRISAATSSASTTSWRADAGRQGGLGLGLAIVDRLGRLLGHPVELDSRPDRGSRFSVSVPLVAQPHAHDGCARASGAIADPAHGRLIMVIDDDTLVLDGMRGILQSWGCEVRTAASGAAALAELSEAASGRTSSSPILGSPTARPASRRSSA